MKGAILVLVAVFASMKVSVCGRIPEGWRPVYLPLGGDNLDPLFSNDHRTIGAIDVPIPPKTNAQNTQENQPVYHMTIGAIDVPVPPKTNTQNTQENQPVYYTSLDVWMQNSLIMQQILDEVDKKYNIRRTI